MEQTPIATVKRMNRRQLQQKQFIYMRPNSHDWNTVWPSCLSQLYEHWTHNLE